MVSVVRSTVINAPVEAVWQVVRDFNDHDKWHPVVVDSVIEDGKAADQVGCVRRFHLQDGSELREQLLKLCDRTRSFTYCILSSPIPLIGYVATLTLKPVTDGSCTFWDWRSTFRTPPGREAELAELVGRNVYEGGFQAVRAIVEPGAAPAARATSSRPSAPGVSRPGNAAIAGQGIVISRHGGPEALRWQRIEAPPPGPGEVRLRHTAVGLNYIDVYVRTGFYPLLAPPGVPGMEAAGEVIDVGAGVVGIMPGDRVAYACPPVGAYAQVRTMRADQLVVLPAEIDDQTAAAAMLKGMTAEYLLRRTHRVKRGDTVLVHAAAGGAGMLLCQWARHIGARVIGTVSSEDKARLARDAGCDFPVVTRGQDFADAVRDITGGKGADVVYDGIGGETLLKSLDALAMRGHLVSYGQAAGPVAPLDLSLLSRKSATLSRPVLFHYTAASADLREISSNLFDMIRRGVIRVPINQRYPLAEAARAHADLEARRTTGATVLMP
jgi:NADPH:quinone reductase-like Zn-dependent oxidoreductase